MKASTNFSRTVLTERKKTLRDLFNHLFETNPHILIKDIIARGGYSLETQVAVTNTGDYKAITQEKTGDIATDDLALYVE